MKCPGQDTQYWTPGAIFEAACPECGTQVEFFKDDTSRKCQHCGHRFVNPKMDFGCAAYCAYAEQCLGDLPPELVAQKEDLLKDRVAIAVKRHLHHDFKKIGRASRRARHVEAIGKAEKLNWPVALMAAYMWELDEPDISNGASPAKGILEDLKAPPALTEQVCDLLAHKQSSSTNGGMESEIVAEAADIAVLEDEIKAQALDHKTIEQRLQSICRTREGCTYARKTLLGLN